MLTPTFDGFLLFVRNAAGIPSTAIADDDPTLQSCYESALELLCVGMGLERLPVIYMNTVYSAGVSLLLNYANDTPPSTYFVDMRKKLEIGKQVLGVLTGAADNGTSGSVVISNAMSNLTLANLMMMQDPFGKQVVAVLMELGSCWGYT